VVQSASGKQIKVLHKWSGERSVNVRTTINSSVQQAATRALAGVSGSATIIAVKAGGGQILGVASRAAHGMPTVRPFNGRYRPGQAFTIVSTAALLAAKSVTAKTRVICHQHNPVGGQPFANIPVERHLGKQPPFSDVFSHACSTEFAVLSLTLTARQLTGAAQELGIGGVPWKLPLPAFTGVLKSPGSDTGELAADAVGAGSVLVSPLDMALVAGAVDAGSWQAPQLATTPAQQPNRSKLNPTVVSQLRNLMWTTVKSGVAHAAYQPGGTALFGQVGSVPLAHHHGLRAIWFVGYRGNVAFAVLVFSKSAAFTSAVDIAGQFAAGLPGRG